MWLQRKEDFVLPVEVEINFDNGEKVREHWDGQNRWAKFQYKKKAKIESAEIDPDHKVQIDRNDFNNSRTAEPNAKARAQACKLLAVSDTVAGPGGGVVGGLSAGLRASVSGFGYAG